MVEAFISMWIARLGITLHIITDRGNRFESELFQELSKVGTFYRLRTTVYHPQINGFLERLHCTLITTMTHKESQINVITTVLLGI